MFDRNTGYASSHHPKRERNAARAFRRLVPLLLGAFLILILSTSVCASDDAGGLAQEQQSDSDPAPSVEVKPKGNTADSGAKLASSKYTKSAYTRRGLIAANPKVLPTGSVVHIDAGDYSGTYIVAFSTCASAADTSDTKQVTSKYLHVNQPLLSVGAHLHFQVRAYSGEGVGVAGHLSSPLEILVPDSLEAKAFGERTAGVTILGHMDPMSMRFDLEKRQAVDKAISAARYLIEDKGLSAYEDNIFKQVARYAIRDRATYRKIAHNPNQLRSPAPEEYLMDIFNERVQLEVDFKLHRISNKAYYDGKWRFVEKIRTLILREEEEYSPATIAGRDEINSRLKDANSSGEQERAILSLTTDRIILLASPTVSLLSVLFTIFIFLKTENRDKEKRAKEIELLTEQIEELKLKNAQLQQELSKQPGLILLE